MIQAIAHTLEVLLSHGDVDKFYWRIFYSALFSLFSSFPQLFVELKFRMAGRILSVK